MATDGNNSGRFARVLGVPPAHVKRVCAFQSDVQLCQRLLRLARAMDVMVKAYETHLEHFARVADVRNMLFDAPCATLAAPIYYCHRSMHASMCAALVTKRYICSVVQMLKDTAQLVDSAKNNANMQLAWVRTRGNNADATARMLVQGCTEK